MPRTLLIDGPLKGKVLQPDGGSFRVMKEPLRYSSHGDPTPIETVRYRVTRINFCGQMIWIGFSCSRENLESALWDFFSNRLTELKDVKA